MEEKIILSMIRHYLNVTWTDEKIKEEYPEAIQVAMANYNKATTENRPIGISSISQGSQSISYTSTELSEIVIDGIVKALLPRPFLKMY